MSRFQVIVQTVFDATMAHHVFKKSLTRTICGSFQPLNHAVQNVYR